MWGTIKTYAYAFFTFIGLGALIGLYAKGRSDAKSDLKDDDYENAEDIRRRVSVDRADKLRKLDDAGWRD